MRALSRILFLYSMEDNMTVKEFIEKLQEMPQDSLVVDWGGYHVEGCHVEEEYYDGDYANPKCPVLTVVMID